MPTTDKDADKLNRRRLYKVLFAIAGVFTAVLLGFFLASAPERSAERCVPADSAACMSCHSEPHLNGREYHIRRISAQTGVIETETLDGPLRGDGTARDSDGAVYGALSVSHAVWKRKSEAEESPAELYAGVIMNGKGMRGFNGDGGPALSARLNYPTAVAVSPSGETYIADAHNHRVRRVDRAGTIETIAGNGKRGFDGDGGPATEAALENPLSLAFDKDGNLYAAHGNGREGRVRKIDPSGRIETAAGGGSPQPKKGDGLPAVEAQLKRIVEVAVDEETGDLLTAESRPILRHLNIGSCAVCHRLP